MNEQTTGLLMPLTASGTTAAVSSMSVIDCGVRITMPMSTFVVFQHGADGGLVAVGAGVADHVDRIAQRGGGGQRTA